MYVNILKNLKKKVKKYGTKILKKKKKMPYSREVILGPKTGFALRAFTHWKKQLPSQSLVWATFQEEESKSQGPLILENQFTSFSSWIWEPSTMHTHGCSELEIS